MSHKTVVCLMLAFLTAQNALFSKLEPKINTSLTGKGLGYSDNRSSSVKISRDKGNSVSVEKLDTFTKESILRFTPNSPPTFKRILRKSYFPEENENEAKRIKYKQNMEKFWLLPKFPNEIKRNKRSVDNPRKRTISSYIGLQSADSTIRVDFSGESSGDLEEMRPLQCRYITNDNRRLIENLADAINCGSFPFVKNGHFELFLGDLDDDIEPRIKCDRYHRRQGPINGGLLCENGKWHFDASCEKIPCKEELEVPCNGQNVSTTGSYFNDTATFSCLYGYELIGDEVLVCGEHGEWIGERPSCKLVRCPNITAPEHGFVSNDLEIDSNQTSFTQPDFNTTITYRCEKGYTLVGKLEFTCQADGKWSPRRRPKCKKVCLVPYSKRFTSTVWLQPYMNALNVRSEFQFGDQIIYLCKKRYKSDNDGGAMCINGMWVPPIKCRRIYACTDPLPPKNGEITLRINRSFIQFACDYGYQISGSETQTCLSNGTWSGTTPKCRKMCRMPQVFAMKNAWLSFQFKKFQQGSQLLVGSMVEYSCKNGYQIAVGEPSTCDDGNWVPEPRCLSTIVRLTGSELENEGLVEIYIDGKWGLVCDHVFVHFGSWGGDESKVVCKMMGYTFGNRDEAANYQRITSHVTYQSVSCSGDEQTILECNTLKARVWCNRFIAVKCYGKIKESSL